MSDKYAALKQAAEKATPGPWEYYHGNTSIEYNVDSMEEDQGSVLYVNSGDFTQKQTDRNGEFIAAANPETILSLLAEREADKARIAELLTALELLSSPSMSISKGNGESYIGWQNGEGLTACERLAAAKAIITTVRGAGITPETGE